MATVTALKLKPSASKQLPPPNSDFCQFAETLSADEQASLKRVRGMRYDVEWEATGCQMGAHEHALKYAQERLHFGKPIGSFQLIPELLAKMLGNITACQCMVVRTAQLADEGKLTDQQSALAKAFTTAKARETLSWARKLLGGNGIIVDAGVARRFADAEALYSYEGTYQMQILIVGKAVTGFSAFV